eukprot:jgi/Orpsp1_1/1190059/evm.model.d7180000076375.1
MDSIIKYGNKNQILSIKKAININWNFNRRKYSFQNSIFNFSTFFSTTSKNFNIYTQNRNNIIYSSHRTYFNINSDNSKNSINKDDNKSTFPSNDNTINELYNYNNYILNNNDIFHNTNIIQEKQKQRYNRQKKDIPKSEKNSYSFFKNLIKTYRKDGKQEKKIEIMNEKIINNFSIPSLTPQFQTQPINNQCIHSLNDINKMQSLHLKNQTININNDLNNANNKVTMSSQFLQSQAIKNQTNNIKNVVNNTNNGINVNKGIINGKIDKKGISSNVKTPINSEIENQNSFDFKLPNENNSKNFSNINESSTKKMYNVNESIKEENSLFNWISSFFSGKKNKNQKVNVNIRKEEKIIENKDEIQNININNTESINMNFNATTNSTDSNTNTQFNSSIESNNIEKPLIPSEIIINQKQNNKNDSKISIKNIKSWFNKKNPLKKQTGLKIIEN